MFVSGIKRSELHDFTETLLKKNGLALEFIEILQLLHCSPLSSVEPTEGITFP